MDKNEYLIKLLKLKQLLKDCGVHKPVPIMIKNGLIKKDKRNPNYLEGRTRNVEFLNALEQLAEIVKFEQYG